MISEGLLASLDAVPADTPFALLLRHAERYRIPPDETGDDVALTPHGEAQSAALAARLPAGLRRWAEASPLHRCMATAAHMGLQAVPNLLLGDPGPFVIDCEEGAGAFVRYGTEAIVRGQLAGRSWPFIRPLAEGAGLLLRDVHQRLTERGGLGAFISHDAIVMPTIRWATGEDFAGDWLQPLDGVVVLGGASCTVLWRGRACEVSL
jgi:hypothetical protein